MAVALPAMLAPEFVTAIVDTREQLPLDLSPLRVQTGTLDTGDYALAAAPDLIRLERKSLDDLLGCVGRERERFDREVMRLLAFPVREMKRQGLPQHVHRVVVVPLDFNVHIETMRDGEPLNPHEIQFYAELTTDEIKIEPKKSKIEAA